MTTNSTLMPLPPYAGLQIAQTIADVIDRHRRDLTLTGADISNALLLVNIALTDAFDPDENFIRKNGAHGLTREQFTQLVCHCFYKSAFETALITKSLWLVANDMHSYIGQISR
ncbi:hypothetical protein ACWD6R_16370 [Streptomyces sp. NPDC005151]